MQNWGYNAPIHWKTVQKMCERLKTQATKTPVEKPARLHGIHQVNGDTPPHDKIMSSALLTFCHNMSRAPERMIHPRVLPLAVFIRRRQRLRTTR